MRDSPSSSARRLGVASGVAVATLCLVYAGVLSVGLVTLPSPDQPIQEPWFTAMEILILGISPAMVALTVAIHGAAPRERRSFAFAGVSFMGISAGITCAVHFAILTLGRRPEFAGEPWADLVFGFRWPSVVYAADILAWDVFFPLAALFAGLALRGPGIARVIRRLLFVSATLAFVGLAGVPLADMRVRNVGILGYALVFPVAAGLLVVLLRRPGGAEVR